MDNLPRWAELIIVIAALLTAAGVVWRRAVIPLLRLTDDVREMVATRPVLVEIANEFKPNAGNSLRDTVDRIDARMHLAIDTGNAERRKIESDLAAVIERQTLVMAVMSEVLSKQEHPLADDVLEALQRIMADPIITAVTTPKRKRTRKPPATD